jgi:hypothetical protein
MIQAMGQVTAGLAGQGALGEVTGIHRPIAVGANYKPTDMYNRSEEDKAAKSRYDIDVGAIDENMKNAIARLQSQSAVNAEGAALAPAQAAKTAEALAQIPGKVTKQTTENKQTIVPEQKLAAAPKEPQVEDVKGGLERDKAIEYNLEKQKGISDPRTSKFVPRGADVNSQAASFAQYQSKSRIPIDSLEKIYKLAASLAPAGTNAAQISQKAFEIINEALNIPLDPHSEEGKSRWDLMNTLAKNGITGVAASPVTYKRYKSGIKMFEDPYNAEEGNSWINRQKQAPTAQPTAKPAATPAPQAGKKVMTREDLDRKMKEIEARNKR